MKEKIDAKNGLEQYIYQVRQTIKDDKLKDKITDEEKKQCEDVAGTAEQWLTSNQDATKDEYDAKKKEVETVFQPIITKIYQA